MNLNIEQIESITTGAVSVSQEPEGIRFYRFTQEQFDLYEKKNEKFFLKSKTTSGVKLCFRTDSRHVFVKFFVSAHIGASFMSFDVFVNDEMVKSINNYEGVVLPRNYMKMEFPIGEFSGYIELGEGEKTVTIHLPWNGIVFLQELSLDDNAEVVPVKPTKKLLALGDSITYGNAAMHPSGRYIARLCRALDAEEFNKGIGGEFFCPYLAATEESFVPDYIVVAYGTNDWRKLPRETFEKNVTEFFCTLNHTYPDVSTIVITPIWRSNLNADTDFDSIRDIDAVIRLAAAERKNTIFVDGFDLVPHDVKYYGDYGCHPNDDGFSEYFKNLWLQIKGRI